jgi:hypothetical protein
VTNQKVYSDEQTTVTILYRNHRGITSYRRIVPRAMTFGECEWHPGPQWLLTARDVDKRADRTFAMCDVLEWKQGCVDVSGFGVRPVEGGK